MPVKKTALGMKIEAPAPPTAPVPKSPYAGIDRILKQAKPEEDLLAKKGSRAVTRSGYEEEIARSQARIPRARPVDLSKRRSTT